MEKGVDFLCRWNFHWFLFGFIEGEFEVCSEELVPAVQCLDVVVEGGVGGALFESEGEMVVDLFFYRVVEVEALALEVLEFPDCLWDG